MSAINQTSFGCLEFCFMAMMAYNLSLGNNHVSREDIATFFRTLPRGCEKINPMDYKALSNRTGDDESIEKAKYKLMERGSLTKETIPGRGKK